MAHGPIRRAHLIGQSGVGGLTVLPGGISVMTGSLDDWFRDAQDIDEFEVHDWRLEHRLGVDHFRLPPDFRVPRKNIPNPKLSVPGHRFPRWHVCHVCHRLVERTNPYEQRRLHCLECEANGKGRIFLDQVAVIACCEHGHIQEFPWRAWVHGSVHSACSGKLALRSKGGLGLGAFEIECDGCKARRSLGDVLGPGALSRTVDPSAPGGLCCQGRRPWDGVDAIDEPCERPLTASIRTSTNVYFAHVYSSLYLPITDSHAVERLIELLSSPPLHGLVVALGDNATPELLKASQKVLSSYTLEEIGNALAAVRNHAIPEVTASVEVSIGTGERPFREREHQELIHDRDTEFLMIKHLAPESLGPDLGGYFGRVGLVPKLKETRVQAGFSRIVDQGPALNRDDALRQMWRSVPDDPSKRWLPAYQVYGEGIFLQLDEQRVREWESRLAVRKRIMELGADFCANSHTVGEQLARTSPHLARLILAHSLAHALMREFVVSCGYSMAALRERLYIAHSAKTPMASVLIYTASGDSAGSLGGLVRLGAPEHLGPMLRRALARARWCAADPVCMEAVPEQTTSTRESANLAACHNCMFVPETSCEEFNGFLDRAFLVGTSEDESVGFFGSELTFESTL